MGLPDTRGITCTCVIALVWLTACGGSGGAPDNAGDHPDGAAVTEVGASVDGAPEVEERYQELVNRAWRQASDGRSPATTCAGIRARASRAAAGSADRALAACDIDLPIRYYTVLIERVEAAGTTCTELMLDVTTSLRTMTTSVQGLSDLARQAQAGDGTDTSAEAASVAASAVVIGAAGAGETDARRAIIEAIRERVTSACPDEAPIMLR